MNKAFNQYGKLVDIIESIKEDTYTCPVCKEILTRNFGAIKQFYSHPFGKGDGCELKFNYMMKDKINFYNENDLDILRREYYEKKFDDVKIELSDYMSEEGYYLTQEQKDIIFAKEDRIKIAALAGASKSHSLYYYAKNRPFKKILYVVYNKSMKDSADLMYKKLPFVTVKTQHGLAYGFVGKFYKNKLTLNYGIVDVIKDLNLNWNKEMELATKIDAMMKVFMLSDKNEFNEINLFRDINGDTTEEREKIINKCNILWELKKEYKNNIKIEHDFYLKMFHLSKTSLENKYDIIMVDECLPKSQLVKTDQGIISINKLYDWYIQGKELPKTLSYNIKTDTFEYKDIIGAKKSENRQLLEIVTEGLTKLQCTENHKVLTQRGYVKAKNLVIGKDSLILDSVENQKTKFKPNNDQIQIILGSFLGDGSLSKMSKFNTHRLNFTQGIKQVEYLKSKTIAFGLDYHLIESGYTHELSICQSNPTKVFLLEKDIWELMNDINEIGLAIWYQDDGSYNNGRYCTINSNQLTYEQTEYMRNILLDKYNIEFNIGFTKGKYYLLRANKENSDKFINLIHKHMHPSMQYKSYIDISNNVNTYNNKYLNHGGNYIKSINKIHKEDVYDIEVKDNHNFVTTRSRYDNKSGVSPSGIVVHNCQDLSKLTLDVLKSSNVKGIVLVGDKFQSIYNWRSSVNIMPLFEGKEYKLTTSFRVSQNIANIANLLISDFIGEDINMKGFNTKQTIVDKIDKSKPYVCLCRTNAYIFAEIADALSQDKNKKFFFEGGFKSYNFSNLRDCYFYSKGHPTKNKLFSKFKNFYSMREYAEDTNDIELLSLIRMVDKYGSIIVDIVDGIQNNAVTDKSKANIIFSTCHRAKGATYHLPVYISDDILDLSNIFRKKYIEKDSKFDIKKYEEEINIIYVAITRPYSTIELNDKIKDYLILRHKYFNKLINT